MDGGDKENKEVANTIVDHCLNQAFTQTPLEAYTTRIETPDGFNDFHLKNMIKVYNSFGMFQDYIPECIENPNEESRKYFLDKSNDGLLSIIYLIQLDKNLYYLFNLLFNFYNNTVGMEEKDLSKLRHTNTEKLKMSGAYDCSVLYKILVAKFDSKTELMQKVMNLNEFPLYCAIIAVGYWCDGLIKYIRDHLYFKILNLLDKKSADFSSYNNNGIVSIEFDFLLRELTLHKMDEEIDSNLKYNNDDGILTRKNAKINYILSQLVNNYNQVHKIITGKVTEKLKQCAINEVQAYYNENKLDVSNKIPKISENNICVQCKTREPIFYEAQSAENNKKNEFCTKICQMKFHNYII
jgi:hypothetical protein